MSGRRGSLLEEDEATGQLREVYSQMLRAANAAGYSTQEPLVQVALITAHGFMSVSGSITNALLKLADEIRKERKGGNGGYW